MTENQPPLDQKTLVGLFKTFNEARGNLENKIKVLEAQVVKQDEVISTLNKKLDERDKQNREKDQVVQKLRDECAQNDNQILNVLKSNEESQRRLQQVQEEYTNLLKHNKDIEQTILDYEKKYKSLNTSARENELKFKVEVSELREKIMHLEEDIKKKSLELEMKEHESEKKQPRFQFLPQPPAFVPPQLPDVKFTGEEKLTTEQREKLNKFVQEFGMKRGISLYALKENKFDMQVSVNYIFDQGEKKVEESWEKYRTSEIQKLRVQQQQNIQNRVPAPASSTGSSSTLDAVREQMKNLQQVNDILHRENTELMAKNKMLLKQRESFERVLDENNILKKQVEDLKKVVITNSQIPSQNPQPPQPEGPFGNIVIEEPKDSLVIEKPVSNTPVIPKPVAQPTQPKTDSSKPLAIIDFGSGCIKYGLVTSNAPFVEPNIIRGDICGFQAYKKQYPITELNKMKYIVANENVDELAAEKMVLHVFKKLCPDDVIPDKVVIVFSEKLKQKSDFAKDIRKKIGAIYPKMQCADLRQPVCVLNSLPSISSGLVVNIGHVDSSIVHIVDNSVQKSVLLEGVGAERINKEFRLLLLGKCNEELPDNVIEDIKKKLVLPKNSSELYNDIDFEIPDGRKFRMQKTEVLGCFEETIQALVLSIRKFVENSVETKSGGAVVIISGAVALVPGMKDLINNKLKERAGKVQLFVINSKPNAAFHGVKVIFQRESN